MLTVERLKEVLHYDPETGAFTWVGAPHRGLARIGQPAGSVDGKGYPRIKIDGERHGAHRLAWLYVYGVWPKDQLDHINIVRLDNRIANLREATNAQNCAHRKRQKNSASGVTGVSWHKRIGKWRAYIKKDGVHIELGYFGDIAEDKQVRDAANLKVHGEFASVG